MNRTNVRAIGVLEASVLAAAGAWAQCEPSWDSWGPRPGMNGRVLAITRWDPDGPGPQPAQLIAGGEFTQASGIPVNSVARWDGARWWPMGGGMDASVRALAVWDPDGPGPLTGVLIAGGQFRSAGGQPIASAAAWDGEAWTQLGGGLESGDVYALTTWDPDGPGPLTEELVACGHFELAEGRRANRVAAWNGSRWRAFGSGINGAVYAVTVLDPDEEGPQIGRLVVGGLFSGSEDQSAPLARVAWWDGVLWQPVGAGMDNGEVSSLTVWDPDGGGPIPASLWAGGSFTSSAGQPVNRLGRWNGVRWEQPGEGLRSWVRVVTTWDPDGSGPAQRELLVGGVSNTSGGQDLGRLTRWDGTTWRPIVDGFTSGEVRSLAILDSEGPAPTGIVAGGVISVQTRDTGIAAWNGSRWSRFGSGFGPGSIETLTTWDPDGQGPEPINIVAAGNFKYVGDQPFDGPIARWDGTRWRSVGSPILGGIRVVSTWDPDGDGPTPPVIVASGAAFDYGGVMWASGGPWQPFGAGTNGFVWDFATWDEDRNPDTPGSLVIGGQFTQSGGQTLNHVARWDGALWRPLGSGMNAGVTTLTLWDADGPEPLPEQLIAAGFFTGAGGSAANRIAAWDGERWSPLGEGLNNTVLDLTTWDPDGPGPMPTCIVAGGAFTAAGNEPANRVARWDGERWHPLGDGLNGDVLELTVWDPDGPGPLPPRIVAGGNFTASGEIPINRFAFWDGHAWQPIGTGMNAYVGSFARFDPDGAGPAPEHLVVGGNFTLANNSAAAAVVRLLPCEARCDADFDGDGFVDFFDLSSFFACFDGEPCPDGRTADVNADGFVDFFDLDAFLDAFEQGC